MLKELDLLSQIGIECVTSLYPEPRLCCCPSVIGLSAQHHAWLTPPPPSAAPLWQRSSSSPAQCSPRSCPLQLLSFTWTRLTAFLPLLSGDFHEVSPVSWISTNLGSFSRTPDAPRSLDSPFLPSPQPSLVPVVTATGIGRLLPRSWPYSSRGVPRSCLLCAQEQVHHDTLPWPPPGLSGPKGRT